MGWSILKPSYSVIACLSGSGSEGGRPDKEPNHRATLAPCCHYLHARCFLYSLKEFSHGSLSMHRRDFGKFWLPWSRIWENIWVSISHAAMNSPQSLCANLFNEKGAVKIFQSFKTESPLIFGLHSRAQLSQWIFLSSLRFLPQNLPWFSPIRCTNSLGAWNNS